MAVARSWTRRSGWPSSAPKQLFGAEHANVQPHSGAQANAAAYLALIQLGDTVLGMDLKQGGHLTHGSKVNFSGKFYNFVPYGVSPETETIDYDELERLAQEHRPKLVVAGFSAYSRNWTSRASARLPIASARC